MTTKNDSWVSDVYWYEIIKKILFETKQYLFIMEIWEKLQDKYGYPYNIDRVKKELSNLERTGYAVSGIKKGKQVWMYPTGEKLLNLEQHKIVDSAITEFLIVLNRIPTVEEVFNKIKEPINREVVSKRLTKISKLTDLIDEIIIKKFSANSIKTKDEKKGVQRVNTTNPANESNMLFYNTVISYLNGTIGEIDILTIITIIDIRKKYLYNNIKKIYHVKG